MLKAQWCRYRLDFRFLAKTSRDEMLVKDTYFVKLYDSATPDKYGLGEVALFKGLSADDVPDFEAVLSRACADPACELPEMSSIRFGFETAMADLSNGGRRVIYDSDWINGGYGIPINGLIWMGDKQTMLGRIEDKISQGFNILKLKIGGINFDDEVDIIASIRKRFNSDDLELRLDANGSFTPENALKRLERLNVFGIHSLEQPVKPGQPEIMSRICKESPIDIALDEELIGFRQQEEMDALLSEIKPAYIILKPSLCGGFAKADQWIAVAESMGIRWWGTSALESNIGLNAIAQWVASKRPVLPQGLGTGALYHNNIASPLGMIGDKLFYHADKQWVIPQMQWQV